MSLKSTGTIIIGLILGSVLGFGGAFIYYSPQIQELDANLNGKIAELETTVNDYSKLNENYNDLTENYDELTESYEDLNDNYEELQNLYEEINTGYENLLEEYELLVASLPLSPQPISGEIIEMEYEWYYDREYHSLSLSIPETQYEYYKNLDRIHTSDYSVYVTHPYDDEYINTIIKKFNHIALEEGLTEEEKINLVISFVQSLPYTVDIVTTPYDEYPRYPLETLIDNGGDCEDTSILTASLLKAMMYDIILIAPPEHMAVGVNIDTYGSYWTYEDEKYFFLETTGEGWEIGVYPDDLEETAYMYPLNPIPMCVHDWVAQWKGRNEMDVTINVTNLGSAMAENYRVYAAFDAGEGYVWNSEESKSFNLNFGNSVTITLTLDVPRNEHTRLIVGVLDSDGYLVDESYSEWFDT